MMRPRCVAVVMALLFGSVSVACGGERPDTEASPAPRAPVPPPARPVVAPPPPLVVRAVMECTGEVLSPYGCFDGAKAPLSCAKVPVGMSVGVVDHRGFVGLGKGTVVAGQACCGDDTHPKPGLRMAPANAALCAADPKAPSFAFTGVPEVLAAASLRPANPQEIYGLLRRTHGEVPLVYGAYAVDLDHNGTDDELVAAYVRTGGPLEIERDWEQGFDPYAPHLYPKSVRDRLPKLIAAGKAELPEHKPVVAQGIWLRMNGGAWVRVTGAEPDDGVTELRGLADVNGDGKLDLLLHYWGKGFDHYGTFLCTGDSCGGEWTTLCDCE